MLDHEPRGRVIPPDDAISGAPDAAEGPVADVPSPSPNPKAGSPRRQIETARWRIDHLRPVESSTSREVFEALESALAELTTTVEELRLADEALLKARAEVERERANYRELFDHAPDAFLVTDLRGVIREANRAASVLLRIEHRQLVGKPLIIFVPQEGRSAFRSELARLRDLTGTAEYDLRLTPRKLPPIEVATRVGVVRDARGRPTALRWAIRDVSARKRAEEEIRALNARLERRVRERSEQLESSLQAGERLLIKAHAAGAEAKARPEGRLLEEIVHEADAILWRADAASGRYTFVSRRAEELLGYPVARWIDEPDFWPDHIHPEDRDWAIAYRRKHLRDGDDHEAEYRVVAADGHAIWFREIVRVLRPDPDGPAVLCGLMVNISRRKKVERQLYTAKGELASRLRDMTYLHELGGRLSTARGLPATLDEVLSAVSSLLGAEMATVLLRPPGTRGLSLAASAGLPDEFARLLGRGPLDPGAIGRRLDSRETVVIGDVEADPAAEVGVRHAARAGGFRALVGAPLFTRGGDFLGAVAAFFPAPHRPPDRQLRLVEMYAEHAANAIEDARLRGEIEESDRLRGRALASRAREMDGPLAALLEAARSLPPGPETDPARDAIERHARHLARIVEGLGETPRHDEDVPAKP